MKTLRYAFLWGLIGVLLYAAVLLTTTLLVELDLGSFLFIQETHEAVVTVGILGIVLQVRILENQTITGVDGNQILAGIILLGVVTIPFLAFAFIGILRRIYHGVRRNNSKNST